MHTDVQSLADALDWATSGYVVTIPLLLVGLAVGILAGRLVTKTRTDSRFQQLEADYTQSLRENFLDRRIVENTSDGLVVATMDGTIIWANPAYCTMMQRQASDIVGRNPLSFALPPEDTPTPDEIDKFRFSLEEVGLVMRRNIRANGEEFWNQINVSVRTSPDGTQHAIMSCRDATEQVERQKELESIRARLEFMVAHDDLTGLANRAELLRFAGNALESARNGGPQIGILRMDLDRFKELNDTYGHSAGDLALVHVSQMMRQTLRQTDLVARIGGDEFVAICTDVETLEDLEEIARSLSRACSTPFDWGDGQLQTWASIGATLADPECDSVECVLQHADFALYEVKRSSRGNVAVYDDALRRRFTEQKELSRAFFNAVRHNKLSFYFQPVLNLADATIAGFETLVRWNHPDRGVVSPDVILPLALELGIMADLDLAAMEAAFAMKHALQNAGHTSISFGINASSEALLHPDYLQRLDHLIQKHDCDPSEIAIEVLETVILSGSRHAERHNRVVTQLFERGFGTLLDDFGTGHAGLSHLAQHNFTGVKLDRSLVSQVLNSGISHRIVRTIAELCHELDLRLIAEGVEDHDTAACLRHMGCDAMQGYWLSRPIPQNDVVAWVQSYVANPVHIGAPPDLPLSAITRRAS